MKNKEYFKTIQDLFGNNCDVYKCTTDSGDVYYTVDASCHDVNMSNINHVYEVADYDDKSLNLVDAGIYGAEEPEQWEEYDMHWSEYLLLFTGFAIWGLIIYGLIQLIIWMT